MNIGIVGLGLIGGSIGLDLRTLGYHVLGVSRREQSCQKALALGAVDEASLDLSLLSIADVIFICTPIAVIIPTLEELIPILSPTTILTDVGSVKAPIVEAVSDIWPNFVGGHPMAGKAENGIEVAQLGLFQNRPYVLTPTENTPLESIEKVEAIARMLKSKVYFCDPYEHDRAVALISHLPVMASASLILACMSEANPTVFKLTQDLASSGFRDTSRVGGGNPELGLMMAKYNSGEVLRSLYSFREQIDQFIQQIEQEDWQTLEEKLRYTEQNRKLFLHHEI
ncbi:MULTISPECIES: prephenate/arogenate dehydrogenase [Okeania]|uniref:Prephenate/arogenate dehydrogenase n=1 Tax=Okeania hirsuta TaxID=1458930 RepID=A0A3N6P6A9_9CYAN|nr:MULTISPECIES: prephenate/arogenate dehydrogenase [Okeania]NEP06649.1 prephenate/arogenate dehydrogenase [Okeania sp. SIO4D6]NEP39647.1 prephenate/arogenate dehydrogenase [Okeania sp. SIO2H7]NET13862.1 prephenate/arogenate dehydrogenase [Okeania sp. SIO1H6]NEP75534.1 prephenate/arogenate dehydrogenase [Okeania sp. SIO2G5]NEP95354.1 prephenate/arogenate dehydrogenase [Okeania sp. SIO2F5]